jgi:hypothetical protein
MSSWIANEVEAFADSLTNLDHQNWEACKAFVKQVRVFSEKYLKENNSKTLGVSKGQLYKFYGLFNEKGDILELKRILEIYIVRAEKKHAADKKEKQRILKEFLQFLVQLLFDLECRKCSPLALMRFLLNCFAKTNGFVASKNNNGTLPEIPNYSKLNLKQINEFTDKIKALRADNTPTFLRKILEIFQTAKTVYDYAMIQLDLDYIRSKENNQYKWQIYSINRDLQAYRSGL